MRCHNKCPLAWQEDAFGNCGSRPWCHCSPGLRAAGRPLASLSQAVKISTEALAWMSQREWVSGRRRGGQLQRVNYNKEPFLLQLLCRKHMFSDAGSSWVKDTLQGRRQRACALPAFTEHLNIFTCLPSQGLSCQLDLLASVISFSRSLSKASSSPLPQCFTLHIIQCARQTTPVFVLPMFGEDGNWPDGSLGNFHLPAHWRAHSHGQARPHQRPFLSA